MTERRANRVQAYDFGSSKPQIGLASISNTDRVSLGCETEVENLG